MKPVYLLHHIYEEDGFDNNKGIGLFTSPERAEMIAQKYRVFEGFRDYPDSFYIFEFEINKNYWEDGFRSIEKKDVPMFIRDTTMYLLSQKRCLARNIANEELKRIELALESDSIEFEVLFELEHTYEIEEDVDIVKLWVFLQIGRLQKRVLKSIRYYQDLKTILMVLL